MAKRKGLMVTGSFPCVRVGKITEALQTYGWEHDAVCGGMPPQMSHVYHKIDSVLGITDQEIDKKIRESDAEIIHVHNEPNWPVKVAKWAAGDRPVILNVHDLTSARPRQPFDPFEEGAFKYADALVFVTETQREQAGMLGWDIDKPYVVLGNYTSSSFFLDKTPLPHMGGVIYEGGIDPRGADDRWRDQSPVADILKETGIDFHIYADRSVDYGLQHPIEINFPILLHRIAQCDWGFCGVYEANQAWDGAIPNKFFDYLAAGIPVIAMNCPQLIPYCEEGMGVYVSSLDQLVNVVKKMDRKPFIKAIKEKRGRFTMLSHIDPLVKLYEELT